MYTWENKGLKGQKPPGTCTASQVLACYCSKHLVEDICKGLDALNFSKRETRELGLCSCRKKRNIGHFFMMPMLAQALASAPKSSHQPNSQFRHIALKWVTEGTGTKKFW
eukprot:2686923-Ditylum_brightwellii.AAC.1